MRIVLDTNHFTELMTGSRVGAELRLRLKESKAEIFINIVIAEEVIKGWLARISSLEQGRLQVPAYQMFQIYLGALSEMNILPFDVRAAEIFLELKKKNLRIGTMDLKISSICLAHRMTLLTRNRIDFDKVPGLLVENWLD